MFWDYRIPFFSLTIIKNLVSVSREFFSYKDKYIYYKFHETVTEPVRIFSLSL